MKKKELKKPNFFMIGAPKCGTTAMANFLDQHPEVYFSKPKEPFFFCRDVTPCMFKDFKEYQKYCFQGANNHHQAIGEGSIFTLYSQQHGVKEILATCPNAKFIVMLRNPVDAAISMHGQSLKNVRKRDRELSNDFSQCWHCLPARKQGKKLPVGCVAPLAFRYDVLFSYFEPLSRLFGLVDQDRVHVIIYDDFKQDIAAEYQKVCLFLDIDCQFQPEFKLVNVRSQLPRNVYTVILSFFAKIPRKWRVKMGVGNVEIKKIFYVPLEKPQLSPDLLAEMKAFYRDDIIKTAELIDRDLSAWL